MTGLRVQYLETDPEHYVLPLAAAHDAEAERVLKDLPHAVVARLKGEEPAVLYDATWDPGFCAALLAMMAGGQSFAGNEGKLNAVGLSTLTDEVGDSCLVPTLSKAEQSNSSIIFGDRYILKIFRRVENGVNPDLEIGRMLTERQHFANCPEVLGYLEYKQRKGEPITLAVLLRYVPNQGTGWQYTLDALSQYLERVLSMDGGMQAPPDLNTPISRMIHEEPPPLAIEAIGPYLESVRVLGRRTAEMHLALASESDDPAFSPEPFTPMYQRSTYQSMRTEASRVFQTLNKRLKTLPDDQRKLAREVLDAQTEVLSRLHAVTSIRMTGRRFRLHGDYHLGQVLYTGNDFYIIDFEGEPLRSLTDRRLKRSALRDVAGMIRSFHYAAYTSLLDSGSDQAGGQSAVRSEDFGLLEMWCRYWYRWVAATFLRSYIETSGDAPFLPSTEAEFITMLRAFVLSKAVYELDYELAHRPAWMSVPMLGILDILKSTVGSGETSTSATVRPFS
jgi:maltose alpha-D-glucosyltransferase/alpha-amylase